MVNIFVNNQPQLSFKWTIYKGGQVKEDLRQADLFVWLVGRKNRIPLNVTIGDDGSLNMQLTTELEAGIYGLKAIWFKDIFRQSGERYPIPKRGISEVNDVLIVHSASNSSCISNDSTIAVKSEVNTSYGYDGLDAYELSVFRGKTTLSEAAWLEKLNGGGGSTEATYVDGEWKLVFDIKNEYKEIQGDKITIPFEASVTRIRRWSDGRPDDTISGNMAISANYAAVRINWTDKVIEIPANSGIDIKNIVLTASGEDCTPAVITISQQPQSNLIITSAYSPEDGINLSFDATANSIEINDSAATVVLKKVGSVGVVAASTTDTWIGVDLTDKTDTIELDLSPQENNGDWRIAVVKLTYANGKTKNIDVRQSYIDEEKSTYTTTASLSYTKVPAAGGTAQPTASVTQVKHEKRSNGNVIDIDMPDTGVTYTYTDDKSPHRVNASTGVVTFSTPNANTEEADVARVTVTASLNGNTATASYDVKQEKKVYSILMGWLPKSISNFGYGSTVDKITSDQLALCLTTKDENNYYYIRKEGEITKASPKTINVGECGYLIGLVPAVAAFAGRSLKKWNGMTNQSLDEAWIAMEENTGFFANGERTVVVNGDTYKLYANFAADETKFVVINKG